MDFPLISTCEHPNSEVIFSALFGFFLDSRHSLWFFFRTSCIQRLGEFFMKQSSKPKMIQSPTDPLKMHHAFWVNFLTKKRCLLHPCKKFFSWATEAEFRNTFKNFPKHYSNFFELEFVFGKEWFLGELWTCLRCLFAVRRKFLCGFHINI